MRKNNLLKVFGAFMLMMVMSGNFLFAQESESVTDEDLKNYAVIEMAKEMITSSIKPFLLGMIEKQEGMDNNRWMELQKTKAEGAAEWEVKFYNSIMDEVKERTNAAKEVVNMLINNTEMSASKYSAIKEQLQSDADLKAKYEEITAQMN
jgi:hypothetical protein